jgi:hypothetical protein
VVNRQYLPLTLYAGCGIGMWDYVICMSRHNSCELSTDRRYTGGAEASTVVGVQNVCIDRVTDTVSLCNSTTPTTGIRAALGAFSPIIVAPARRLWVSSSTRVIPLNDWLGVALLLDYCTTALPTITHSPRSLTQPFSFVDLLRRATSRNKS